MREHLIKLIKVKTIITLILTIVFAIITLRGLVPSDRFVFIFTTVIAFYFGTQHQKREKEE